MMATTTLLVEILVVGLLAFVSLYVPLSAWTVVDFSRALSLPLFLQIGLAYVTGIIWNRVCNLAFAFPERRITASVFSSREQWHKTRLEVIAEGGRLVEYTEVLRSFVRLSRAAALLSLIHGLTFLIAYPVFNGLNITRWQLVTFYAVLFGLSLFSWYWHRKGYLLTIKASKEVLTR